MRRIAVFSSFALAMIAVAVMPAMAQLSPTATWATHALNEYQVFPNVTYLTATNYEAKLDIYKLRDATSPQPTLIFFHGGGWVGGTKEQSVLSIFPWLEMGWNVVNVEYRLARVALAPAAVEDCMCALRFVAEHAKTYNVDVNKIVVSGESAGGHLALTTGMIPESAGFARECPGEPLPKVAAIIDWYGITDVADLLDGPNMRTYAVAWLANLPNREELARQLSPMTYVHAGLPPILAIQGDADPAVPYQHSVKLTQALTKAGVPNQFVTIPGGKHGGFTREERTHIYTVIHEFLAKHGLAGSGT